MLFGDDIFDKYIKMATGGAKRVFNRSLPDYARAEGLVILLGAASYACGFMGHHEEARMVTRIQERVASAWAK